MIDGNGEKWPMDRENTRVMLDLTNLQGRNLSMLAKVVYCFLRFTKGKNDYSWWSVRNMCSMFECSHSRFYRTLDELKKAGLIHRESGGGGKGGRGRSSHYFVKALAEKVRITDTFVDGPLEEKVRITDTFVDGPLEEKVRITDTFVDGKVRHLGQKGSASGTETFAKPQSKIKGKQKEKKIECTNCAIEDEPHQQTVAQMVTSIAEELSASRKRRKDPDEEIQRFIVHCEKEGIPLDEKIRGRRV
jgi:hypothetical protein